MHLIGVLSAIMALIPAWGWAGEPPASRPVGERHEITRTYANSGRTTDGSMSSARGTDRLVERVVEASKNRMDLEYDLPSDATPEDRARSWQFPARVRKPKDGPIQLLNADELDGRVERWLRTAGLTREDCGRWVYTWNAFRISCDPHSVIQIIKAIDLSGVRAGGTYLDDDASGPGTLKTTSIGQAGETLVAVMTIDPEAVRRSRAEGDVAVGEIMRKPVTLEAALRTRSAEQVSGTITVTFDFDSDGTAYRRQKVTELEIKRRDGHTESEVRTEVVERRRLSTSPIRSKPAG